MALLGSISTVKVAMSTRTSAERSTSLIALVTTPPQRINTDILAALCDILDCEPNDLLQPVAEQGEQAKTGTADAKTTEALGIGELRPIRARVRRPHEGA